MSNITYSDNPEEFKAPGTFYAEIPSGISSKEELLKVYAEKLHLPDYFGHNWDALDECLSDFHWIEEDHIVVYHQDLPMLSNDDIQLFLDLLNCAAFERDRLSAKYIFPLALKDKIEYLIPSQEEMEQFRLTRKLPKKL